MSHSDAVEARFQPGHRVAVRLAYPPGHVRTPYYVRGKAGIVERLCGVYGNPEELAYARSGLPRQPLYRVRFRQGDVWPDYAGRRRRYSRYRDLSTLAGAVAMSADDHDHDDGHPHGAATAHRHPPRADLDDTLTYYRAMEVGVARTADRQGRFHRR